jgi:hypothetical protein
MRPRSTCSVSKVRGDVQVYLSQQFGSQRLRDSAEHIDFACQYLTANFFLNAHMTYVESFSTN